MSKRSKKKKRYIPTFQHPEGSFREPYEGEITLAGKLVRIYVLEHIDQIRFGLDENFDRWANSTDFRAMIPRTERQYESILEKLEKQIEAGNYDKGWAKEIWL